ncbi:MAG: hypothetical protein JWN73_2269 [Betaproteobacteria bacterium]|nr:hypothetical protein [Betaproteobacteria bacterium]
MFDLIDHYFWLLALAGTLFQYRSMRKRMVEAHRGAPGKAQAATRYMRRYVIGMSLLWAVMGCGQVTGSTPMVWYYFRPQDGNPFVLAWLGLALAEALLFAFWVFLADGARKIVELKLAVSGRAPVSPFMVKVYAALAPFGVLLWIFMAISMNAPLPK